MQEFEIDCVSRSQAGSTHDHITHIGNSSGKWRLACTDAAAQITVRASRFYLMDKLSGKPVYIHVMREGVPDRITTKNKWTETVARLSAKPQFNYLDGASHRE